MTDSRGPGRPALGDAGRAIRKTYRLTKAELEEHERAAKAAGQTWTSWVRDALAAALASPTAPTATESGRVPAASGATHPQTVEDK